MTRTVTSAGALADAEPLLATVLDVLRERTGCDFSRYRPATIQRRVRNRMISLGVATLHEYLARLEAVEDEAVHLLARLTIKVSRFYRNSATFEALRRRVIPEMARQRAGAPLRIWSAGCGNGEEAYSLAMLLEEADVAGSVDASDIDPMALATAVAGVYPAEACQELPAELAARYLERRCVRGRERYAVRQALRRRVRFVRHDLTSGAPAPGSGAFDLVCCRNVLIYLDRGAQQQVLARLRRAVVPDGFLCLGEAEFPGGPTGASFEPFGPRTFVFRHAACRLEGDTA
ncbi:MAG TPA: protein-glutamate O-methyltransferase CheR [Burkholderiales bacterium]